MLSIVYCGRGRTYNSEELYMYDIGIKLKIHNPPKEPYTVELDNGQVLPVADDIVTLPDELFLAAGDIELYLCVMTGRAFNTLCKIVIPVKWRPSVE